MATSCRPCPGSRAAGRARPEAGPRESRRQQPLPARPLAWPGRGCLLPQPCGRRLRPAALEAACPGLRAGPRWAARRAPTRAEAPQRPASLRRVLRPRPRGGARLARPDEVFVSANGSPVMLAPAAGPGTVIRATIGKSRTAVPRIRPHVAKGGADAPPPATSAVHPETEEGGVIIDLATADGRALDLSKPDVAATLSGADKEAALARLLALQSQVASVLSKLNA